MTDIVDMASDLEAELLAVRLARIDPAIPKGTAGECVDCGEHMPRIVEGRCAFCRDGRTPPADWFERHPRAVATTSFAHPTSPPKETPMSIDTVPTRKISFVGDALRAIDARASMDDSSFAQAAAALVMAGWQNTEENIDWTCIDNVELVAELSRRLAAAIEIDTDALAAATLRAETAEAKVDAMHRALGIG